MFGTVLTTVVTVMHLYVFLRAGTIPLIRCHVPRGVFFGTAALLLALFFAGRFFSRNAGPTLGPLIELFSMNWLAAMFLCSVCLLAVDLPTFFGLLFRDVAGPLRGIGLAAGLVLCLLALFQGMRPPVVKFHEVRLDDLPAELDGTVIAALSDTHLGDLIGARWLRARVEQVQNLRPDLILLLGDIFEGHGESEEGLPEAMRGFEAPLGVWAVLGNHEFHGRVEHSLELFEQAGVRLLRNAREQLRPGLVLAGVDYARGDGRGDKALSQTLDDSPPGAVVFLSHAPARVEQAATAGADLMLCGHTHGGQLWPFSYLVKNVWPYLAGRYEVDEMTLIVSRGTGTWGPRMRLWHPGEILRITLRSAMQTD